MVVGGPCCRTSHGPTHYLGRLRSSSRAHLGSRLNSQHSLPQIEQFLKSDRYADGDEEVRAIGGSGEFCTDASVEYGPWRPLVTNSYFYANNLRIATSRSLFSEQVSNNCGQR